MKLTRKHAVAGFAAAGVLAGALTAGGVALASSGPAPAAAGAVASATTGTGAVPAGSGTGICDGYGLRAGQPVMPAAADYLGLSQAQLRTRLHQGSSLADIARAQGKPVSGLENAILAAMTSRINADTRLTAAQKTAMIDRIKGNLDAMVNTDMGMDHWADEGTGGGMGWHMGGSPMGGPWS